MPFVLNDPNNMVNEAARALFFAKVKEWPLPVEHPVRTKYTRATLEAAWGQIEEARRRARSVANGAIRGREDLGERIERSGVPYLDIADACGVSLKTVCRWVSGALSPSPSQWSAAVSYLEGLGK